MVKVEDSDLKDIRPGDRAELVGRIDGFVHDRSPIVAKGRITWVLIAPAPGLTLATTQRLAAAGLLTADAGVDDPYR